MNVSLSGPCASSLSAVTSELMGMGWVPRDDVPQGGLDVKDWLCGHSLLLGDNTTVSALHPCFTVLLSSNHVATPADSMEACSAASYEESHYDFVADPSDPMRSARAIAEAAEDYEGKCARRTVFRFRGDCFFLSNMCPLDVSLTIDGLAFESAESAYQALKMLDPDARALVSKMDGKEAKRYMHERSSLVRPDWGHVMRREMERILIAKFTQSGTLRRNLLSTRGLYLLEGNTWHDDTWGVCRCENCAGLPSLNLLGKSLMKVRSMFEREGR